MYISGQPGASATVLGLVFLDEAANWLRLEGAAERTRGWRPSRARRACRRDAAAEPAPGLRGHTGPDSGRAASGPGTRTYSAEQAGRRCLRFWGQLASLLPPRAPMGPGGGQGLCPRGLGATGRTPAPSRRRPRRKRAQTAFCTSPLERESDGGTGLETPKREAVIYGRRAGVWHHMVGFIRPGLPPAPEPPPPRPKVGQRVPG